MAKNCDDVFYKESVMMIKVILKMVIIVFKYIDDDDDKRASNLKSFVMNPESRPSSVCLHRFVMMVIKSLSIYHCYDGDGGNVIIIAFMMMMMMTMMIALKPYCEQSES